MATFGTGDTMPLNKWGSVVAGVVNPLLGVERPHAWPMFYVWSVWNVNVAPASKPRPPGPLSSDRVIGWKKKKKEKLTTCSQPKLCTLT